MAALAVALTGCGARTGLDVPDVPDGDIDEITGDFFDAGVSDYVTKPFSIPQLTARVRACLARTTRLPS